MEKLSARTSVGLQRADVHWNWEEMVRSLMRVSTMVMRSSCSRMPTIFRNSATAASKSLYFSNSSKAVEIRSLRR